MKNSSVKTLRKTVRLNKSDLEIIQNEIKANEKINSFTDFFYEAMNAYFENRELKKENKDQNKIKYIDEKTSMMLLMLADVVSIQLAYDDEKRIKYISEIHEELASKIRFNQKLY